MGNEARTIWTHTAYLVIDPVDEQHEPEAYRVKVGMARLSRGGLHVELLPGLSVSGRLLFELRDATEA